MSVRLEEQVDFVVVTALEEERDAVLSKLLVKTKLPPAKNDVRVYYRSELKAKFSDGTTCDYSLIIVCLPNMGRVNASNATTDAIHRWEPRYVLLVGIAGGVKESGVRLGDILVSDQVVDYELQKISPKGDQVRFEVNRADARLVAATQNFHEESWMKIIGVDRPGKGKPKRIIGPIATGDKVQAFGKVFKKYQKSWPKLIGVEMEAGGVASACHNAASRPGFFMIRGVSDLMDKKDSPTTKKWRKYASQIAAAYAIDFLQNGPVLPQSTPPDLPKRVTSSVPSNAPAFILSSAPLAPLFSRDPSISLPACELWIAQQNADLPSLVERLTGLDTVSTFAVRKVLAAYPEKAATLLVERVLKAAQDWHGAAQAAKCLSESHRVFSENRLAGELMNTDDPDLGRCCIDALGNVGSADWAFRIVALVRGTQISQISDYQYEKYYPNAVLAIGNIFALSRVDKHGFTAVIDNASFHFMEILKYVLKRGWDSYIFAQVGEVLARCMPWHADVIIKVWLSSDEVGVRALAARTLGQMHLARARQYLANCLSQSHEERQVLIEAALALGNIGGAEAVNSLVSAIERAGDAKFNDACHLALARCVHEVEDNGQFRVLAKRLLDSSVSEASSVYRAVGLRKDMHFVSILRRALNSTEQSERGQAALALARVEKNAALGDVRTAYREAARPLDRILSGIGLLEIGDSADCSQILSQLRDDLAVESYRYIGIVRKDILATLGRTDHPLARLLADTWAPIYAESPQY